MEVNEAIRQMKILIMEHPWMIRFLVLGIMSLLISFFGKRQLIYKIVSALFCVALVIAAIKIIVDLHEEKQTFKTKTEQLEDEIADLKNEILQKTREVRRIKTDMKGTQEQFEEVMASQSELIRALQEQQWNSRSQVRTTQTRRPTYTEVRQYYLTKPVDVTYQYGERLIKPSINNLMKFLFADDDLFENIMDFNSYTYYRNLYHFPSSEVSYVIDRSSGAVKMMFAGGRPNFISALRREIRAQFPDARPYYENGFEKYFLQFQDGTRVKVHLSDRGSDLEFVAVSF